MGFLDFAVEKLGANRLIGRLVRQTDMPKAVAMLVVLTQTNRLAEIPQVVTPAQLHNLLADIRQVLPNILRRASGGDRPPDSRTASGSRRAAGAGPHTRRAQAWGPRPGGSGSRMTQASGRHPDGGSIGRHHRTGTAGKKHRRHH